MNRYYFDSSALLKYYLQETGTNQVENIIDVEVNIIFTSLITMAEVASVLGAKFRASHNNISNLERQQLLKKFITDSETKFILLPVRRPVINQAIALSQIHRLRGYDSVQLGTAVLMQQILAKHTPDDDLIFVASDTDLLVAAQTEGLQTENPMLY